MDRNQAIIAVVAAVFVVFSLTVSMVVSRRYPDFPGRRLPLFFGITLALVAGMLTTVVVFGGEDAEEPTAETQPATTGGGTASAETGAPAESGAQATTGAAPEGNPAAGKEVFATAGCTSCHTLAAAGATGTVGPNLDDVKPSFDTVVKFVTNGSPPMPAFGKDGTLTPTQIQDVAAYVVQSTSG